MRHENGFGSISKLSGSRRKPYAVRITTGWKDGKQVRKYLGFYKTQHEALMALAEYHKNSKFIDLDKLTLNEIYERWIKRIEPKVSTNVLKCHRMAYNRFGALKNKPLVSIKADHLQDWMDSIDDLSPGTKRMVKSTMIQIWKYAIKNDIVTNNYAEYIEITGKVEKKGSVFTTEEIQQLWEDVGNPTAQWILILIYTGMRIGELLQMTTDTMYLEDNYMVGGSKSEAGTDRVIPIHDDILPLVNNLINDTKYLILDEKGKRMNYNKALRVFKSYMEARDWKHLPHDTRKTAVSLLHSSGVPMEVIRVIVGHSAKGITEKVYLYKSPQELVDWINKIVVC